MTFSERERRAADNAELERLIAALMSALRGADASAKGAALTALTDFRTQTLFPELRDRAAEARAAGANALMDEALKELAAVAGRLNPLAAAFADAATIAASGKKELLFPRIAASAGTALEIVAEMEKTAEAVKAKLRDVRELGDLPAALKDARVALKALKDKVEVMAGRA
jgi:hypothetical protein